MCRSIQDTNTSGPAQEILVLIPLASCDGSYEPKHSRSPPSPPPPPQSLPFSHSKSMVPKWVSTRDSGHLSHWWAAMTHTSLSICTVSPVSLHFAYTKYGSQATNTRGPAQRDSGTHRISEQRCSCVHGHYAIQPEPSLHACTQYGSRGSVRQSLRPLTH